MDDFRRADSSGTAKFLLDPAIRGAKPVVE
jgi:hypothetical protein